MRLTVESDGYLSIDSDRIKLNSLTHPSDV